MISVITTVLKPGPDLVRSMASTECLRDSEHIITVAREFDRLSEFVPTYLRRRNVRFIQAEEAGISEGFNIAIRESQGEYVWVLNAGDELVSVEPLVTRLSGDDAVDFVYGDVCVKNGKPIFALQNISYRSMIWHGMGFCHGAMVIRRQFHERFGFYSPLFRIAMDYDLMLHAVREGARGAYCQVTAAALEPGGVSSRLVPRTLENMRVIRRYLPFPLVVLIGMKWVLAGISARFWRLR